MEKYSEKSILFCFLQKKKKSCTQLLNDSYFFFFFSGNFEMLDGKHHFQSKINQFRGGKFQCASKCMMSLECKVFLLDFLKGNCQLYSGFTESSPQEDGIDCNSSSIGCFARL